MTPVSAAMPKLKARILQSGVTEIVRFAAPTGRKFKSVRSIQIASTKPRSPPKIASVTLSTSNCEMIRERPAPNASRIAISFWRAVARAINRFAMFAQAINKTRPTSAISTSRGLANWRRSSESPFEAGSRSMVIVRKRCLVSGAARAKAFSRTSISSI